MKRIAVMIATLSLATTSWAQGDRTENGRKPMQTANEISMVAPALTSPIYRPSQSAVYISTSSPVIAS